MNKFLIISLSFVVLLSSCKSIHPINTSSTSQIKFKKLLKKIKRNNFSAQNFSSRFIIQYENNTQKFTGRGKIKVLKDSIIWGSINFMGIPAAKFLLTPKQIKFYNKIDKTYYNGDYQAVSQLIKNSLNYQNIQNIIFSNPIKPITQKDYQLTNNKSYYTLTALPHSTDINTIEIIPKYKVKKTIFTAKTGEQIIINYTNFIKIKKQIIPTEIFLKTNKGISLKIQFKNPKINQKQTYPFKIPKNFNKLFY